MPVQALTVNVPRIASQFASQFVREGDRVSVGRNDGIVVPQPAAEEELVCGHVDGWHADKTRPVVNPVVPVWVVVGLAMRGQHAVTTNLKGFTTLKSKKLT
jgi:hypothetical protein